MSSLLELAILAGAAYDDPPGNHDGWVCTDFRAAGGGGRWDGLQAAAFTKGGETVLAFRGTVASAADILADVKLGVGFNTSHFAAAEDFAEDYDDTDNLSLCGHSLGGAIAQVVGNRREMKFATFNAPGVAVFASRNIGTANPYAVTVRAAGAVASAFLHPIQAYRDVAATFNIVKGVNVCLSGDVVSQIGVQYGNVLRIPGTGANPLEQHGIATVIEVLRNNPVGALGIGNLG